MNPKLGVDTSFRVVSVRAAMVDIAPSQPPLHLQPPLPVAAEPATVAVQVPPNEVQKAPAHEKALIRKWIQQATVPSWLRQGYDQWDKDRKYLHTDLFAADAANTMSVNLAARAIQAKVKKISPTDADLSIRHQRGVGSVADVRRDAIRQANAAMQAAGMPPQAQVLIMAAEKAEQEFRMELEAKERFAQTSEALVKKLWDEAGGTAACQQMATQGMTVGVAWIKVGWQRDFGRDSLGRSRTDDAQDQLAFLSLRASEYAHGLFTEDDPRFAELVMLSDYARKVGRAVTAGQVEPGSLPFSAWQGIADTRDGEPVPSSWLPEPEAWQGPIVDAVRPEAMRWDWRVPFERWSETPWTMEQNLMDVDDAATRFKLTPAERDILGSPDSQRQDTELRRNNTSPSSQGENADPDRTTYEDRVQRGQVVVWERWDRQLRRRCIFVEGLDRFLVNEVPKMVAPGFYPYVPIAFNVLDGKHLPVSDVCFLRKIQDAINQRLTDSEESLWASMKRYLVRKGAFKDGELDKLRGARPHDVIEVDDPDDIKKTFTEIASDDWNPNKYNLDQLFRLFELVSGMSISELGVTGQADFATEAAIANQASQENAGRHADVMAKAISRAMEIILHYACSGMSQRVVKGLVGTAAFWPQAPSRYDLIRNMSIKVTAAGSAAAAKAQAGTQLRDSIQAVDSILGLRERALMQGATMDADPLLAAAFKTIDTDRPVREVLSFPAAPPPGMGGPPMQQPGAPPQPQSPAPPGVPVGN